MDARKRGWKKFVVCNLRGQPFRGLGPDTEHLHVDLYDNSGDYTTQTHKHPLVNFSLAALGEEH